MKPIQTDLSCLVAEARFGQLDKFMGIASQYAATETTEIHVDTTAMSIDDAAETIVEFLGF